MLGARIALRARGLFAAFFAPVPQNYSFGFRSLASERTEISFKDVLNALIKGSSPAHEDRVKRLRVISELQDSLSKAHLGPTSDVRVLPFGSFVNSLYEPNSDLDLAIVGQIIVPDDLSPEDKRHAFTKIHLAKLPREYATELLRTAVARFVQDGLADTESMVPVLHARVPIVKFVHPATGINVDVCLGSEGDSFKTWSLAQLMALHPVSESLCRVVKIWAKAQGINDPRAFTFNSWCLNLLVVFFLQRHTSPELLPPLKALIYDYVGHPGALVRLMHGGRQPPGKRIVQLMAQVTKNAGPAREAYGRRPAKPLDELFLDFLDSNSRLLKAALTGSKPLSRGTAISVFYGNFHTDRHFRGSMLFVEDPLNDLDNTARTLRPAKDASGRSIDYVAKAFSGGAKQLRAHLHSTGQLRQPRPGPQPRAPAEGQTPNCDAVTDAVTSEPAAGGGGVPGAPTVSPADVSSEAGVPLTDPAVQPQDALPTEPAPGAAATDAVPGHVTAAPSSPGAPAPVAPASDDSPPVASASAAPASAASSPVAPAPAAWAPTAPAPAAPASVDSSPVTPAPGAPAPVAPAAADSPPVASASAAWASAAPEPAAPAPAAPASLASTAVFLFGAELVNRVPELSAQLLGPELHGWARGALAAGRPAGEVHEELVRRVGAVSDFESFVSFRRRCGLRVLDEEEEHWTPEELDALMDKKLRKQVRLEREAREAARERRRNAVLEARKRARREALQARRERLDDAGDDRRGGRTEPQPRVGEDAEGQGRGAGAESQARQQPPGAAEAAKPFRGGAPPKAGGPRSAGAPRATEATGTMSR